MPRQLAPEHEAVVDRIVASVHFESADAVIGEALHLLEEREQGLEWLRAELQPALEQEARGELIEITPDYFDNIQRRALESARQGKPIRDAVKP
jgi:Arc/MetJ-type ribon-helix-helix transcriptional regulator